MSEIEERAANLVEAMVFAFDAPDARAKVEFALRAEYLRGLKRAEDIAQKRAEAYDITGFVV